MDPPDFPAGGKPSPTRKELQGPRPSPLRVSKDSHKIRKPPVAPQPFHPQAPPPPPHPPPGQEATTQNRQPVIIYAVTPKVIHATVSDFMSLVQRLTGPSSSASNDPSAATSGGGDVSPAARLASIERTSPKERERAGDLTGIVEGVEVGQIPGILSPAPATLPPISPGYFSPGSDPYAFSLMHDQSPFMNMFLPSPSNLFSAPIVSPSPSSMDLFNFDLF
uniref:VQ domain-containing protein n=1 Tax=Davidia involucrata TaxID=16924 RepID=A0A5B6ZVC6_DAVIN